MDTKMQDALSELRDSIRELGEKRKEIEKMQDMIDQTQGDTVDQTQDEIKIKKEELKKKEEELKKKQNEIDQTQEEMKKKMEELKKKQEELQKKEEELKKIQMELGIDQEDLKKKEMELGINQEELMKKELDLDRQIMEQDKEGEALQTKKKVLQRQSSKLQRQRDELRINKEMLERHREALARHRDTLKKKAKAQQKKKEALKANEEPLKANEEQLKNNAQVLKENEEALKENEEQLKKNAEALQTKEEEIKKYTEDLTKRPEEKKINKEALKKNEEEKKINKEALKKNEEKLNTNREELKNNEEELKKYELALKNKQEEQSIKQEELSNKQFNLTIDVVVLRKKQEELKKKKEEIQKKQDELKKKINNMQKALHAVNALKILKSGFIDDQIQTRLESSLKKIDSSEVFRLFELESIVSDTLDDVRLLVLENIARGSGNEMLRVIKVCSDPIVKVISTKKNIKQHFRDSAKVVQLDQEKSEQILNDSNLLTSPGVLLESDILEVLNFPSSCPDRATIVVKITAAVENSSLFKYHIALESKKKWEKITTEPHEGYVQFPLRDLKHFFVISSDKWQRLTLTPKELYYEADVKDVTVRFPPGSVTENHTIEIEVMCPKPAQQTTSQDPDNDTDIISVSPRLWVKHDGVPKFKKSVIVTLPCPSASSTDDDTSLCLIKWTEDDEVYIFESSSCVKGNVFEFEVDGFCGYCSAVMKNKRKDEKWKPEIRKFYKQTPRGCLKQCNFLIFLDKSVPNTLRTEIVESKHVKALLKERSQNQHLAEIPNTMSRLFSIRYGESINVYAREAIKMHPRYNKGYMKITFGPQRNCNHIRFEAVLNDANSNAVLEFQWGEEEPYMCHFQAEGWLRKRHRYAYHQDLSVGLKSLRILANQIPVQKTLWLATELEVKESEVGNLKAQGHQGIELTAQIIFQWHRKRDKEEVDMVAELVQALKMLSENVLASKLLKASKESRRLVPEDFQD